MSRASDEDVAEQVTLPRAEDSFGDVDDLDPAIGEFVRELGRGPTGGDSSPPSVGIKEGARLAEHFQVLRRIGAGGMGVVVLARDLRLDREVAIKLVGGSPSEQAAARLQREAQAMAQLAHPNVVAVHEVGTVGDTVYIAMEYVEGGTARSWAKAEPRTWPEILDVYLQAARGLAAAHAAGLVHRDFKPDNVLVGKDGRVRVADFGLARSRMGDATRTADTPVVVPPDHASFQHATLTATDAVVGTPGYMAPEQFANKGVGPAVDQFAFAVALYEALYGERPYGPHAALPEEELVLHPAPSETRVPRWLRRVLVRALAPRPERRFADMQALVRALERGRARSARVRNAVIAIGGAAIVAGVGLGVGRELRSDPCDGAAAGADAVWSTERAIAISEAVAEGDGAAAWAGLVPRVAVWIEQWSQARRDSCTATRVDATRSDALLDRSFVCFDERLHEVDAWLALLEEGDRAAVHAIGERDVLPSFAACGDTTYLLAQVDRPADPQVAARVDELAAQLIAVQVMHRAGARARARAEIDRLEAPIESTGYAPLHAGWLYLRGNIALASSEFADAQRDLHAAYVEARTAGADARAAAAALDLAFVHGVSKREVDIARVWLDHVEIDIARGVVPPEVGSGVATVAAIMAGQEGRHDEAIAHGERAVELADAQLGVFSRIEARKGLAAALDAAGRHREAIALFEEVLADIDAVLGADAITRLPVLTNLGLAYYQVGRYDEAIAMHERANAITRRSVGDDHVDLWTSEFNLGLALVAAERHDEAAVHLDRARGLVERLGPDFEADRALVLSSLAWHAERRGRLDEAVAIYREALPIHRRHLPEGHPEIALQLTRLADVLLRLDRVDEAAPLLEEALAIWVADPDEDHPSRAETWLTAARLDRALGRPHAARQRYADVLALAAKAEVLQEIVDDAHEELAALPRE